MKLANTAHFITAEDPDSDVRALSALFNASAERCQAGYTLAELTVVGPRTNSLMSELLTDVGQPAVRAPGAVAWGVWLAADADPAQAPIIQTFRFLPHLGKRPVLVSENRMRPAELVVVTESSDFVVAVMTEPEDCAMSALRWYVWTSDLPATTTPGINRTSLPPIVTPEHVVFAEGRYLELPKPWLRAGEDEHFPRNLFDGGPSFQFGPILPAAIAGEFAEAVAASPWSRRAGDIYTQDSMDIVAWARGPHAPPVVRDVVELVSAPDTIRSVTRLTGMSVTHLREFFAYRLLRGERILNHADTAFGGELLVRINWLLSVPPAREWDLRFWSPAAVSSEGLQYRAVNNRAVAFEIGEHTPHDVAPLQVESIPRVNVVLTFGLAPKYRAAVDA